MHLYELFNPSDTKQSVKSYRSSLNNRGIKTIGSGMYATVYKHTVDPRVVVKVHEIDGDPKDDGYLKYVRLCRANANNPYLPKIYDVRVYKNKDGMFYAVIHMEKLTSNSGAKNKMIQQQYPELASIMNKFVTKKFPDKETAREKEAPQTLRQVIGQISDANLQQALAGIAKIVGKGRINGLDIHSGNVMWRGNQLVITDPVM